MYPAVLPMYFISAAVILRASLALIVQVSLPYKKTEGLMYCIALKIMNSKYKGKGHHKIYHEAPECRGRTLLFLYSRP